MWRRGEDPIATISPRTGVCYNKNKQTRDQNEAWQNKKKYPCFVSGAIVQKHKVDCQEGLLYSHLKKNIFETDFGGPLQCSHITIFA